VGKAAALMEKGGMNPRVVVDCSHANSSKKHENQPKVQEPLPSRRA